MGAGLGVVLTAGGQDRLDGQTTLWVGRYHEKGLSHVMEQMYN